MVMRNIVIALLATFSPSPPIVVSSIVHLESCTTLLVSFVVLTFRFSTRTDKLIKKKKKTGSVKETELQVISVIILLVAFTSPSNFT